jgi:hypothetical protein
MDIVIDFDGTCVSHEFPLVGNDIGAVPVLKKLVELGHRLILFTMRSDIQNPVSDEPGIHSNGGTYLTDAVNWFLDNGIPLYGVQSNPTQRTWTTSPKAYGQLIIDDAALGCPLKVDPSISSRPFVDWAKVEECLLPKQEKEVNEVKSASDDFITEHQLESFKIGSHIKVVLDTGSIMCVVSDVDHLTDAPNAIIHYSAIDGTYKGTLTIHKRPQIKFPCHKS